MVFFPCCDGLVLWPRLVAVVVPPIVPMLVAYPLCHSRPCIRPRVEINSSTRDRCPRFHPHSREVCVRVQIRPSLVLNILRRQDPKKFLDAVASQCCVLGACVVGASVVAVMDNIEGGSPVYIFPIEVHFFCVFGC